MRLRCQKAFLLVLLSTLACSDSSGPATISGRFELNDIDGRSLPTPPAFTPGLTPTILSGTVALDGAGDAVISEHRTEWNGADATSSSPFTYTITGSRIQLDCVPAGVDGLCDLHWQGTLVLGQLSLIRGYVNSDPIIYHYRLAN